MLQIREMKAILSYCHSVYHIGARHLNIKAISSHRLWSIIPLPFVTLEAAAISDESLEIRTSVKMMGLTLESNITSVIDIFLSFFAGNS